MNIRLFTNKDVLNSHLYFYAAQNDIENLRILINSVSNLDMNVQDNDGYSPLILATAKGHACVVSALLNAKADPNLSDKNAYTSLMWAAVNGDIAIINALLDAKADLHKKNKTGDTALDMAVKRENAAVVEKLIHAKASRNRYKEYLTIDNTTVGVDNTSVKFK